MQEMANLRSHSDETPPEGPDLPLDSRAAFSGSNTLIFHLMPETPAMRFPYATLSRDLPSWAARDQFAAIAGRQWGHLNADEVLRIVMRHAGAAGRA